jgi:hypothetical protein
MSDPEVADTHWSEESGQWYYVSTISDQWDHIIHDVEAEELGDEFAGMFLLSRDGNARPVPTTRTAWELIAEMDEEDDPQTVCVGRIVDGMCVPIGTEDEA